MVHNKIVEITVIDNMDFEEAEASNPVTIKERIDNALSSLSDLSTASMSRSEILSGLSG